MSHRPFTRAQALQNRRFLRALRATGNPRLAAALLGVHRSTYLKRRKKSPAFAHAWNAALAAAHADFHANGGPRPPEPKDGLVRRRSALRTEGGELTINRTRNGRLQLRRAPKGWLTKAGEQAFLAALSATANVRLSAAAAGVTHSAIYQKKSKRRPFAREMRLALKQGWHNVEAALLAAGLVESHEDDAWRHNDPPPIPPMTPGQALQLLHLHDKSVNQSWDKPHRRRRRGEPWDTYTERLRAMWLAEKAREAEEEAVRLQGWRETPADWRLPEGEEDEEMPVLPALEQVKPALEQRGQRSDRDGKDRPTGRRSRARSTSRHDGALTGRVHNPDLALFGGWRITDWKKRER